MRDVTITNFKKKYKIQLHHLSFAIFFCSFRIDCFHIYVYLFKSFYIKCCYFILVLRRPSILSFLNNRITLCCKTSVNCSNEKVHDVILTSKCHMSNIMPYNVFYGKIYLIIYFMRPQ